MICDKMKSVFAKIFGYDEDSKPDPVNLKPIDPDTVIPFRLYRWMYRNEIFDILKSKSGEFDNMNEIQFDDLVTKINRYYPVAFPDRKRIEFGETSEINNMIKEYNYPFALLKYNKNEEMLGDEYSIAFLNCGVAEDKVVSKWKESNIINCLEYCRELTSKEPIIIRERDMDEDSFIHDIGLLLEDLYFQNMDTRDGLKIDDINALLESRRIGYRIGFKRSESSDKRAGVVVILYKESAPVMFSDIRYDIKHI